MSEHYFSIQLEHGSTESLVKVKMGWDRPLQGFYLIVQDSSDSHLYSNLDTVNPFPDSLDVFVEILDKMAIPVPAQMFNEIEEDKKANIGNKVVTHSVVGGQYSRVEDIQLEKNTKTLL